MVEDIKAQGILLIKYAPVKLSVLCWLAHMQSHIFHFLMSSG